MTYHPFPPEVQAKVEAYLIEENARLETLCREAWRSTWPSHRHRLQIVDRPTFFTSTAIPRTVASDISDLVPRRSDVVGRADYQRLLGEFLDDLEAELGPVTEVERQAIDEKWSTS